MARPFTTDERNAAKAAHVWHLSRCEVLDVDDTWQDLSDLGPDGLDTYLGATIATSVDANCWTASIRVLLGYGGASLSPLMFASLFNRDVADVYAPLLNCGTRIRLWATTQRPTDDPGDIDEKLIFDGRIDVPNFTQDPMTLTCRDLGGKLIDTFLRTARTYGDADDPPTDAQVIQQILTDNADILGESIELVDASATPFYITNQTAVLVSVMDAITLIASLSGKVVRYRFQADGTFKLTLYDVVRDAETPDYTLEPDEYLAIENASLDFTQGRNFIRVWYTDGVTGESASIDVFDAGSIAAFGEKFEQLGGDALASITNGNDALALGQYALADQSTPLFDHTAKNTFTWFAEPSDYVGFTGDNVHYDEDQALGLFGITHEFPDGGQGVATTDFQCRGKPAGGYTRWLRLQGGPVIPQIPPAPELLFFLGEATQFGGTADTVDGAIWLGYRMPPGVDEIRVHVLLGMTGQLGVPNIDGTTLALTIRRPEGNIGKGIFGISNRYPGEPGEYASMALLSTRTGLWKKGLFYGVKAGLTSIPVITPATQAVDPTADPEDGTIASLEVVRVGGSFTLTVTPATVDPDQGSWLCIMRNEHILPPVFINASLDPVVYVDDGLPADDSYNPVHDAFIWSAGKSGPLFRAVAEAPTLTPPEFADGTPLAAVQGGSNKVQVSWTASTAGATGVRVEASLDKQAVRVVGSGSLASGTVYDTVLTPKFYRLVAFDGSTDIAWSEWAFYATIQGPLSNPLAVPTFVNGTPKPKLAGSGFTNQLRLSVQWKCQTPNARLLAVMRSTAGSGGPFTIVPGSPSASVAAGEWLSPEPFYALDEAWYKLEARASDGTTVLASSLVTHYVAP